MIRAVVNPTFLSVEKSYDVTIQMKPLWQTFYLVLLFFRDFTINEIWILYEFSTLDFWLKVKMLLLQHWCFVQVSQDRRSNTHDQITSDKRYKCMWWYNIAICVFHSFLVEVQTINQ